MLFTDFDTHTNGDISHFASLGIFSQGLHMTDFGSLRLTVMTWSSSTDVFHGLKRHAYAHEACKTPKKTAQFQPVYNIILVLAINKILYLFNTTYIKNILNRTQKSPPPKLQLSNSSYDHLKILTKHNNQMTVLNIHSSNSALKFLLFWILLSSQRN